RHLVALADDARDLGAHLLDRDVQRLQHPRGEPLLLAEKPEQDVLGAHGVVLERPFLVLREDDYLTRSLCESLEQLGDCSLQIERRKRPHVSSEAGRRRWPPWVHRTGFTKALRNRKQRLWKERVSRNGTGYSTWRGERTTARNVSSRTLRSSQSDQ